MFIARDMHQTPKAPEGRYVIAGYGRYYLTQGRKGWKRAEGANPINCRDDASSGRYDSG